MALGKKSQVIVVYIMIAVIIFILALQFIQPINESVKTTMNSSAMNCTATTNTTLQATCVVLDMGLFYFISVAIAVGLGVMTGNKTISGILTAIFVFVLITVMIIPLKSFIVTARDSDHLDCDGTSISVGSQMLCIFVDLWLFLFFVMAISSAITYITLKKIAPKNET